MPILDAKGSLHFFRLSMTLSEFPEWLSRFHATNPDTAEIEVLGQKLAANDYPPALIKHFVERVCHWGGYSGIGGRILKGNRATLAASLRSAHAAAYAGDVLSGLEILTELKGCGVSFASKHLKFLAPDRAVVLDSIIATRLGYPLTLDGYREFLEDCGTILSRVRAAGIAYPGWGASGWRISDIEMAVFQKLQD